LWQNILLQFPFEMFLRFNNFKNVDNNISE